MSAHYTSHWRITAAEVIARVLEETKGRSYKEIREALRLAYPFGEKAMYPYKIWLDEIRRHMTGGRTSLSKPRERKAGAPQYLVHRAELKLREWQAIYGRRSE